MEPESKGIDSRLEFKASAAPMVDCPEAIPHGQLFIESLPESGY
ncbi:hypothetical protein ACFLU4_07290 [Chloroflexota bacterium]